MSLGAAETFGVALMMLWGTAGAVALGRAVAKSPAMREFAAGFRKRNLAAKCALDRLADRPATIQMEARDIGDFVYRYDFSAASPTNEFFIGAQLGFSAIEALGVRGGMTNAATVYRVDGAHVPEGVSVADLFSAPRLEMRWKNVAGLGDLSGDTDGDGLTDWQETFLHDTDPRRADTDGDGIADGAEVLAEANPLDADEDGDGVPDGIDADTWAACPLWGDMAGKTNLVLSLDEDVPAGGAATLLLGSHAIPLRMARTWALCIPEGPGTPFELRTMNGAVASLSLSEPSTGAPDPIHLDDSRACPHRDECPAKESESADCTCTIPVIRVTGAGTPLSERAELAFPTEAYCCCSRPSLFTYARLTHIDSNLFFWNAAMPTNWVDPLQCPDSAMILATDESGATPSRIDYQLVRRRYDDHGAVATNEVFGTGTLRVWATTLTLEPVTTVCTGSRIVNPCGIATNETAVYRMEVSPAAFPDERIEWSASPNGRVRFVGDDNTGREVSVLGLAPGDVTLTANVRGYAGPPPLVRARVMPRTTVPVYAWIVCGTNGVPAVEESDLRGKFPEINRIWDQVGITWQLAEVNFVTNQAWVRIRDDETRTNLFSQICSFGTAPGGVELYCVGIIDEAGGLTNTNGCVVRAIGTDSSVADAGQEPFRPMRHFRWRH